MPDETTPPTLPPAPGASGEEILRHTLPVLVEAVTKSAEGHLTSAAAIHGLEREITDLKGALGRLEAVVERIAVAEERQADEQEKEGKRQVERGEWLRTLVKPETIYYTLVIILTALGFRLSTLSAPSVIPAGAFPSVEQPAEQELP